MKTTRTLSLALALLLPALASAALNEGVMTYSGYLRTSAGAPETTAQTLIFKLHDASTAGNQVWTQLVVVTPDSQGWFTAVLGTTGASFFNGDFLNQSWLGIQVGAEAEMTPRTKMGAAPHALSVEYAGLSGCGTTVNQILQWSGTAWTCIATPAGAGGGVSSVSAAAGTPITVATGTTTPVLSMSAASATASGFLSLADWSAFNAKAPTASPTFTGTVTAPSFAGNLTGNATTATSATSATTATTATTALSANAVAASAVTPAGLNAATAPTPGQVPARDATDTFIWVSPLAAPAAACSVPTTLLTWNGTAFACVADANSGGDITSVVAGTGLTGGAASGDATLAVSFAGSGVANTVARSDHGHPVIVAVPVKDLVPGTGVTLTTVPVGNGAQMNGAVVPANSTALTTAVTGTITVPVANTAYATIRVVIRNSTVATQTYDFLVSSTGLIPGVAIPTGRWGNSLVTVTVATGATAMVQWSIYTTVTNATCMSDPLTCQIPGVGDLLWFSFGSNVVSNPAYDVVGLQIQY